MTKNNTEKVKTLKKEKIPDKVKEVSDDSNLIQLSDKKFNELNLKVQNIVNEALKESKISTIEFLNDDITVKDFIDTGWEAFNYAISGDLNNGYPVGRISEISGDPSTGKTLLATVAAVNALKKGFIVYYLDSEQAFDVNFAKLLARTLGIDPKVVEKINYMELDKVEDLKSTLSIITNALEKNKINSGCLIVIDSLAFLTTSKEIDDFNKNVDSVDMTKAKKIRSILRVLKNTLKHINTAVLFTNQLTYKIGVLYGNPKDTSGGTAVPFGATTRVEINSKKIRIGSAGKEKTIGLEISARCKKSRLTTPYKKASFPILFNGGIDRTNGLLDLLVVQEVIKKKNNITYTVGDIDFKKSEFKSKICNEPKGREALRKAIIEERENTPIVETIDVEEEEIESGE